MTGRSNNEETGDPNERPPKPLSIRCRTLLVDRLEFISDSHDHMADRSDVQLITQSVFSWMLLILAGVVVVISLIADVVNIGEVRNWFKRSGAVLVIASLFVEVRAAVLMEARSNVERFLSRMNISSYPSNMGFEHGTVQFRIVQGRFRISAWCAAGFGTAVWAYGDLIMCLLLA